MPLNRRSLRPGGGSASFNPKRLTNLALWMDASSSSSLYSDHVIASPATELQILGMNAVAWYAADAIPTNTIYPGNIVKSWNDKCGFQMLQGDYINDAWNPTYIPNAINGKPALRFTGGQWLTATSLYGDPIVEYFIVCRIRDTSTPAASYGRILEIQNYSDVAWAVAVAPNSRQSLGTYESAPANFASTLDGFDSFAVLWGTYDTSTTGFFLNARNFSTQSSSAAIGMAQDGTAYISIGQSNLVGSSGFNGDVAEVICFGNPLEATDRAKVEAYLAAKYAIPAVHSTLASDTAAVSSPRQIGGCVAWYDGADSSTMFNATSGGTNISAGGYIARWEDKSGNGFHLTQVSGGAQPALVANQQNGRSIVRFDGNDGMNANMVFQFPREAYTVFAVVKLTAYVTNGRILSWAEAGGIDYAAGSTIPIVAPNGSDIAVYSGATHAGAVGGFSGAFAIFSGVNAYNSVTNYSNGGATATASGTVTTTTKAGRMAVGQPAQGGAGGLIGDIAEIIVYNCALRTPERQKIEQYLATKWGITGVTQPTPKVGAWTDSSGNSRHATQATDANRPLLALDAATGKPCIDNSNSSRSLTSTATVANLVGTATTSPNAFLAMSWRPAAAGSPAAVGCPTNINSSSRVFLSTDYSGAGSHIFDIGSVGGARLAATVADEGVANTITIAYRNGSEMYIRRNGAQVLAKRDASGVFTAQTGVFSIGLPEAGSSQCFFNELLAYSATPSLEAIVAMEKYLAKKWGVSLAPHATNADARDWIGRVYAQGGSVSQSTASAVNAFCNAIDAAGIRSKFLRLNLFCGTAHASDLTKCGVIVPLYRGSSLTATQLGNATDSPNFFGVSDYVEYGSTGGLLGASTKYLNTGLPANSMAAGNRHLSAYVRSPVPGAVSYQEFLGAEAAAAAGSNQFNLGFQGTADRISFRCGSSSAAGAVSSAQTTGAFWIGSSFTTTTADLYKNGAGESLGQSTLVGTPDTSPFYVFAMNRPATPGPADYYLGRLSGYSIGLALDATGASNFNAAMQAFQSALGRNV